MLAGVRWIVVGTALVALLGCGSSEKERALVEIDDARQRLAALATSSRGALARDSVKLARQSLHDAERAVRRESRPLDRQAPPWREQLDRALASVEIALWVVERERAAEREEATAWIDSAAGVVLQTRASRLQGVHFSVQTRLRRAEVALAEARRLAASNELAMAAEKAREAMSLAGELPPETEALFARFGDPTNVETWRRWVRAAMDESRRTGHPALVVDKRAQIAFLWTSSKPERWLDVELGYNGLSRKLLSGDGATPEGLYRVVRKKGRGETRYYKALLLDYPNNEDRRRFREAKANGEISHGSSIGGLIEIHGDGGRGNNWTDGCVAVTNPEMDYLFEKLAVGSPVIIVGSYAGLPEMRGSP